MKFILVTSILSVAFILIIAQLVGYVIDNAPKPNITLLTCPPFEDRNEKGYCIANFTGKDIELKCGNHVKVVKNKSVSSWDGVCE